MRLREISVFNEYVSFIGWMTCALVAIDAPAATPPTLAPLLTINSPAPSTTGQFGFSFSSVGNDMLIGERRAVSEIGKAHLFTTAGSLLHSFANPTPSFGDHYSQFRGGLHLGVGATQDLIAIPDHGDDVGSQNSGSVHIYDASTFSLVHTISNPTPASGDQFGADIATIPGTDMIIVGAVQGGFGGAGPGEVHVYDARTGVQQLIIPNPTPSTPDRFGSNVEAVNNRIVVSALTDDTVGTDRGAAYVFNSAGVLQHSLFSPSASDYGFAGAMTAIPGTDLVALGDTYDSTLMSMAGSVHIFSTITGLLVQTIHNPTPSFGEQFGEQVAVIDDDLLVASTLESVGGFAGAGIVYRFDIPTGNLVAVYPNPAPHLNDHFGTGMMRIGNRLFIGSPGNDATPEPGYVYVYNAQVPEPSTALIAIAAAGAYSLRSRRRLSWPK